MSIAFEPLAQEHCAGVMEIYNHYVENSMAAYPETRLGEGFYAKILEATKGYPAFALRDTDTGAIVGYCFMRAYNPFSTFAHTAEISYFIEPGFTGRGLGKAALARFEEEATARGIRCLLASVSSANEQSLAFHRRNGFSECGRFLRIGEKKGVTFDVVWMQKELSARG